MDADLTSQGKDKTILRDLAKRYLEIALSPAQDKLRDLWKKHNSLQVTRPLVYARVFAWQEMAEAQLFCENSDLRLLEDFFRHQLFAASFKDDAVFEPWVNIQACYECEGWGINIERSYLDESRGSFKVNYPLKNLEDISKLCIPYHRINENKTKEKFDFIQDVIGDIITINVNRAPAYTAWTGDISSTLGYLRGIENFMLDMLDNPEWLHSLVDFLAAGILKTHNEAEATGDWGRASGQNQAMPYAEELSAPAPNINGVKRSGLWAFMAAQELTGVSAKMHEEFLLNYQVPILKKFGLVAYGCCEDLTRKIDMLRKIPNLRRIAVSPFADVRKCAEQIGKDYVISYRPSPADMVSYGFNPERIRAILTRDFTACKNCHIDITLKDVQTVQKDSLRIRNWVKLVRKIISEIFD